MSGVTRSLGRNAALVVLGVLALALLGSTALAGHLTSGVKSYTGCLVSGDGVIVKIKEGNTPRSACTGGQVEAHLSGGDITRISVGDGLRLPNGGGNGDVLIELAAGQTLPSGCTAGRVVEWSGSAWTCGVDDDTTYGAGTGLDLDLSETPDEFSIDPAYRLPGKSCSTAGEFARGFDSGGAIQCAAPSSAGVAVWQKQRATDGFVVSLPKGEGVDVIIMPLPAGTYLVTAVATVGDRSGTALGDEEAHVTCGLRNGAFEPLPANESRVDIGEELFDDGPEASAVVHGVITLASADSVRFTCTSRHGDSEPDEADNAVMTAVKVGTVTTP